MNARGTELISGEKSLRGKSSTSRSRGLCLLAMPLPDALIEGYSGLFLSKEGIAATRCSWRVPKWSSMRIHIIVALLLFWCLPAHATTINAATCSQSDVQNAVNSASNGEDRKSTRLNSSHLVISYAVFCLKKKKIQSTNMNTR